MNIEREIRGVNLDITWNQDRNGKVERLAVYTLDSHIDIYELLRVDVQDEIFENIFSYQASNPDAEDNKEED